VSAKRGTASNPLPANTGVTEPKVSAARTGAGLGAGAGSIVATFIQWALSTYVFHGEVPEPVTGFVYLVVTVGLAAAGAWWRGRQAPHQYRLRPSEQAGKPSGAPYVSGANGGGGFDAGGVVPKAGGHRGGRLPPSGTPG
jgi:hypothetical protein